MGICFGAKLGIGIIAAILYADFIINNKSYF